MMLDGHHRPGQLSGVFRREILGVQVADHQARLGLVQLLQVRGDPAEGRIGLPRFQIAYELADEDPRPHCQRHRILQVPAHGEDGRILARLRLRYISPGFSSHEHRQGRIAAGAPQHQLPAQHDADDRIIYVPDNRAVMDQEEVGDAVEALQRLALIGAERLVAEVPASGHNRKVELAQQQVMQRRVGQHHPEVRIPRGDGHGQWRCVDRELPAAKQDDGCLGRAQQSLFERRDFAELPDRVERREHQREGFLLALLAVAQAPDGLFIARIHKQLEAAQPLERQDLARTHGDRRLPQRPMLSGQHTPGRAPAFELRAALGAGIRLRVKAPVRCVVVFAVALRAHREALHGRVGPVIRQGLNDGEARARRRCRW